MKQLLDVQMPTRGLLVRLQNLEKRNLLVSRVLLENCQSQLTERKSSQSGACKRCKKL
jgi:hypothetical protein